MEAVTEELNRLRKYPQLFLSKRIYDCFFYEVNALMSSIENQIQEKFELEMKNFSKRPTFQPGMNPWQQFLCRNAPGSERKVSPEKFPDQAIQILPMEGVVLIASWLGRYKIYRDRWLVRQSYTITRTQLTFHRSSPSGPQM